MLDPPFLLFSLSIVTFLLDFLPNFIQQVCLPGVRLPLIPDGSSPCDDVARIPVDVDGV